MSTATMQNESYKIDEPVPHTENDKTSKLIGTSYIIGITGIFLLSGFSSTLVALKRKSPHSFDKNSVENKLTEGSALALRALGWGSLYSSASCCFISYLIWKFSGATTFEEFRQKMKTVLPKISKKSLTSQ